MKISSLKSLHFIPANKSAFLDHIIKSVDGKPDALVFDLEDSIKPEAKDWARDNLLKLFSDNKQIFDEYFIIVRINSISSSYCTDDIEALKNINIHAILLPKVENKSEIEHVRNIFNNIPVIVALETIKGIENRNEIISSLKNCDAVVVGYEDLSAELMIERPQDLSSVNPLTSIIFEVFNTARKYRISILDAVCRYYNEDDLSILKKECSFTSTLRFSGKFSIHPNQISIINNYFDKKKINDLAEIVINKFDSIVDASSVIVNDGQMMDTPSFKLYKEYRKNGL
jgi:citrate lyase beta subunit